MHHCLLLMGDLLDLTLALGNVQDLGDYTMSSLSRHIPGRFLRFRSCRVCDLNACACAVVIGLLVFLLSPSCSE